MDSTGTLAIVSRMCVEVIHASAPGIMFEVQEILGITSGDGAFSSVEEVITACLIVDMLASAWTHSV